MNATSDQLKAFFSHSRDGMYISTKEGRFLEVNRSFCRMLGYSREELLNLPVDATLALPLERRRFRMEVEASGSVSGFRIKLITKGRVELSCQIDAVALRDAAGDVDGYIGIVRPGRTLSAPGAEKDFRFDLALRGGSDGHWDWNLRKGEVQFSDRWKSLLGYASLELEDKLLEWFDRIHPEDMNTFKTQLQVYLKGESPLLSCYLRMKTKAGDYGWMQIRGVGDFGGDGKCHRLAGSMTSLQNHLKIYENLKSQEQKLETQAEILTRDKSLLAQYFSGDMLSFVMAGEGPRVNAATSRSVVAVLQLEGLEDLWRSVKPEVFGEAMNEVLTDVMDLVYGHRGTVVKILGDAVVVSFSSPLEDTVPVKSALSWADEIFLWLETFNDVRPEFFTQPLRVSMGMSQGPVLVGSFGSVHRLEYTLLGQPLSRAFQLQRLCRSQGLGLLVDNSIRKEMETEIPTWQELKEHCSPAPAGVYIWS